MAKRTLLLGMCGMLMMSFAFTASGGETPPAGTVQRPGTPSTPIQVKVPDIHILSIESGNGSQGGYSKGPITTFVTVENRGDALASQVKVTQVRTAAGAPAELPIVVGIPAHGKVKITFTDPDGLDSGCFDKDYTFNLSGAGSIDPRPRKAHVHPTCTFSGKLVNPWWTGSDDLIAAQQKDKLYADSLHFSGDPNKYESPLTCGQPTKVIFTMLNQTKKNGSPIFFTAYEPNGKTPIGSAGPLFVGPGKPDTSVVMVTFHGQAGSHPFTILDPNNSLGSSFALLNQGLSLDVTRSCRLELKVD